MAFATMTFPTTILYSIPSSYFTGNKKLERYKIKKIVGSIVSMVIVNLYSSHSLALPIYSNSSFHKKSYPYSDGI